MARYTKVLKSLAHNAVGDRRIQAAAPAGNNYYVTGATLGGAPNYTLSLARNGGLSDVTVNLSDLVSAGTIGGSITDNQVAVGASTANSIEGSAQFKYDGSKLLLGDSSDTGNYLLVEGSDSENTYNVLEGKRKYPRIRLTDTFSSNKTQDIWLLSSQLRIGSNGGTSSNAAMIVHSGNAGNVTFNGNIGIGTTSPSYPLHINGAATQELRIQSSDSGAYSRVQLRSATDGYGQINFGDSGADHAGGLVYTHSTDKLDISAANAVQLSITDNLITLGDGVVLAPHASDNFTIDSPNGIILDGTSASNGVQYHDGGAEILRISNTNSNPVIRSMTDGLDMIFNSTMVMR